jgi:hypothetical protein
MGRGQRWSRTAPLVLPGRALPQELPAKLPAALTGWHSWAGSGLTDPPPSRGGAAARKLDPSSDHNDVGSPR